jgi:hypothetical protein
MKSQSQAHVGVLSQRSRRDRPMFAAIGQRTGKTTRLACLMLIASNLQWSYGDDTIIAG